MSYATKQPGDSDLRYVELPRLKSEYKKVMEGLFFFAILQSTDPVKRKALEDLHVPRIQVMELLDIILPEASQDER